MTFSGRWRSSLARVRASAAPARRSWRAKARQWSSPTATPRPARRRRDRIEAAGGRALAVETDVGDDAQLERLVRARSGAFGRIDILHSHAGIQVEGPLEAVDPAGMDASWRINVRAHFTLARLVMPRDARAGRRLDHRHVVELRRVLRPRDDRLRDLQARRGRDGEADRHRLRQIQRARERALPGLGGYAVQRRLHPADGRARQAPRLHPGEDPDGPRSRASRRSPRRSCSLPPTARPS